MTRVSTPPEPPPPPPPTESMWSTCTSLNCLPGKWNPKHWDAEQAKKIAYVAGAVLAVCVVGIAIYALIPGAYYTVFTIAGGLSLVALIVAVTKYCQQKPTDPDVLLKKLEKARHLLDTEK